MKKIILSLALIASFAFNANAQFDLSNLFISGNLGYAKPIGDFSKSGKGGFTYTGELGYFLNEKIAVGAGYTKTLVGSIGETSYLFGLPSYYVKGWYHFMDGNFKPFVAVGLGIAQSGFPDVTVNEVLFKGEKRTGFGAHTELGFTIGGFHLSYAFNLNGKLPKAFVGAPSQSDIAVNYHRFNIGYRYVLDF